jgi:outer membrane immunogenic protein
LFVASTGDQTRWGATAGAGIEVGFAPNWSVGFEYDHIFLNSHDMTFVNPAGVPLAATYRSGGDVDMGMVKVNYRWGGPLVARY